MTHKYKLLNRMHYSSPSTTNHSEDEEGPLEDSEGG